MSQHYTAHVRIERVTKDTRTTGYGTNNNETERQVTEIVNLAVRSEELHKLIDRLNGHLELVEE